jgi:hypothetical protein
LALTVSRRARSGRSSVTVKKKRKAATALLMLGGRTPVCAICQSRIVIIIRFRASIVIRLLARSKFVDRRKNSIDIPLIR